MITIRREQLEALGAPFAAQFVDQAAAQIAAQFPEQYAALGEEATRAGVLYAIERAETHGLASDEELLAYLALVFVFGRDFDTELGWARAALCTRGAAPQRLAHLEAEALMHEAEGTGFQGKRHG